MLTPILVAVMAIGLLLPAGASAQAHAPANDPLSAAMLLLEADPAKGVASLERLSAAGDVEAKASLAMALGSELPGISVDRERSKRLWEEALAAGSQNARLYFGTQRLQNDDLSDDETAVALLQGLDDRFQSAVAYPMGRAYLFGTGVEQDLARGSRLMKIAVEATPANSDAQFLLGRAYQNGWGIPQDMPAAFMHLKIAADAGDARAQWNVGMMLLDGEGVAADASQAYRYVRQAGEQGYEQGMISLAVMLALGQGVTPNPVEAREWYGRAASLGSAHALRGLGMMMLVGEGGPSDPIVGAAMVEIAAEGGDSLAADLLQQNSKAFADLPREQIDSVKSSWKQEFGSPR
ncbi:tetratricopeptide repeat protein [Brevundimonas sp.]|uniref:tetratricopeptide repeat protein n=1 Tax=Brevundimonas sp. TaxID=1871086 RepID=UPI003567890F